jgi:hypothetical protein
VAEYSGRVEDNSAYHKGVVEDKLLQDEGIYGARAAS